MKKWKQNINTVAKIQTNWRTGRGEGYCQDFGQWGPVCVWILQRHFDTCTHTYMRKHILTAWPVLRGCAVYHRAQGHVWIQAKPYSLCVSVLCVSVCVECVSVRKGWNRDEELLVKSQVFKHLNWYLFIVSNVQCVITNEIIKQFLSHDSFYMTGGVGRQINAIPLHQFCCFIPLCILFICGTDSVSTSFQHPKWKSLCVQTQTCYPHMTVSCSFRVY